MIYLNFLLNHFTFSLNVIKQVDIIKEVDINVVDGKPVSFSM